MRQTVVITLFVLFTGCFLACVVWLIEWMGRRTREGSEDAVQEVVSLANAIGPGDWRAAFPERLKSTLPRFKEIRIREVGPLAKDVFLRDVRRFASGRDISKCETPKGFRRRSTEEKTPEGLLQVEVECDAGVFRDTRNEWYGYTGYFLSLLVFAQNGEIWDARWERADY